jgi:4-hydroxybutyrate---CoA ligase (ADP-forming)
MGNKTDMNEVDILELLSDDLESKVIMMYLEDIHEGRRFMEIAKKITKKNKKSIVALKSGVSSAGVNAAASHTGALFGSNKEYDALFKQSGVFRVESFQDLFKVSTAFSN